MTQQMNIKPGDRVEIKTEAQAAVGGETGIVVGFREEPPAPGVVVAVDHKVSNNAVVAPEDIICLET